MKKTLYVLCSLLAVFTVAGSMGLLDNIDCLQGVVDFLCGGSGAAVAFAAVAGAATDKVEVGDGTQKTKVADGTDNDNVVYDDDLEEAICKVGSNKFVIDTMTRHIKNRRDCKSWAAGGYEIGERPIEDTLAENTPEVTGKQATFKVTNPDMWVVGDVLNVMTTDGQVSDANGPFSLLVVDKSGDTLSVVRTDYRNGDGVKKIPALTKDSLLVRLGAAYNESVARTTGVAQIPSRRTYFNQNFMATVEMSVLADLHKKDVKLDFATYKQLAIFEMRYAMERANLFQVGGVTVDKDSKPVYTATGAWHQITNELTYTKNAGIKTADWTAFGRQIFSENNGSESRLLLPGADFLVTLLSNADFSKQMMEKNTEVVLGVQVKRIETGFGELLLAPGAPLFRGSYSNCAMVLDLANITRETFLPMNEKELNLDEAGISRSKAVRINEISSIYLQNLPTHFRIVGK